MMVLEWINLKDWLDALQGIHIVLMVAIALIFLGYIYLLLRKVTRLPYVGGFVGKGKIRVFGILFGSLVAFYLFYNLPKIQPNEWVQISLLAGLVAATGALAVYAAGQAYTSAKMAEEMREQRYDAARPVIDIQRLGGDQLSEAFAAESENYAYGLSCILHNIGLGPAIDMYSFIQPPKGDPQRYDYGILAAKDKTNPMQLSLNHKDNRKALVAYYKDLYGRIFESNREVRADKKSKGWGLGPLKIRLVEELPK